MFISLFNTRTPAKYRIASILALTVSASFSLPALAQADYPNKPLRWIVPHNAGGASDIVARILGEGLGKALGKQIIIENRAGAGGTIGTAALASAAADGYTMATADNGTLYNNWYLFNKLSYTPNSFEYVAMTGKFPLVLAVNSAVPAKNFQEFQKWAQSSAQKISYGTPGFGSPHHIAMAALQERLGINIQHVPYKGDAPAVIDLVSGQIQTMMMGVATARQYLKDDRIRFVAVTWPERLSSMPDLPTFEEAGLKGFTVSAEQGILMPAGTPQAIVQRVNQELAKVLSTPATREKLETLGMYPVLKSPEEFKSYVFEQSKQAGDIIKRQGITIQ